MNNRPPSTRGEIAIVCLTGLIFVTYLTSNYFLWKQSRISKQGADAATSAALTAQQTYLAGQKSFGDTLSEMQKQSKAMQDAAVATKIGANAAKNAADTAASQLELTERPWIDANIALDGPLTFDANGGTAVPLKITLTNTGHSPAMSTFVFPLTLVGLKATKAADYRQHACQTAAMMSTRPLSPPGTIVLFPNKTWEQRIAAGITKDQIDEGKDPRIGSGEDILFPTVVICIAYRPNFNKETVYHTSYIVVLNKLDSANRQDVKFRIGETVDRNHLFLDWGVIGAITAE